MGGGVSGDRGEWQHQEERGRYQGTGGNIRRRKGNIRESGQNQGDREQYYWGLWAVSGGRVISGLRRGSIRREKRQYQGGVSIRGEGVVSGDRGQYPWGAGGNIRRRGGSIREENGQNQGG